MRFATWMENVRRDLAQAARSLRRSPGFAITAILVLAVAMGANTAIFSITESILLRPLPYREASSLCVLWKSVPTRNIEWDWTSFPVIQDWRMQNTVFTDLAAVLRPEGSVVILSGGSAPDRVQASKSTGNFFRLLGVQPEIGRTFSEDEDRRGESVVVLSHNLWQNRFHTDPAILGRTVRIDDRSSTIIGVMPADFQFPDKTQLWMLLSADSRWPLFRKVRFADAFFALAKLKPGVPIERVRAEMAGISSRLAVQNAATDAGLSVLITPLSDQIAGKTMRRSLLALSIAVFCVLLIACSNISGLLVARSAARRKEIALRAALGASRHRLLWHIASENILLSLAGGVGGVILASVFLPSLLALAPADLPRSSTVGIDAGVLALHFVLCILTGAVFGLIPAWRAVRAGVSQGASEGSRGTADRPGSQRTRGLLVASQFALAAVLLSGAGLLLRSYWLLNSVKPGFDTEHLLTLSIELPDNKRQSFFSEAVQRLEALSGVQGAAIGSAVFESLKGNVPNEAIVVEGRPRSPDIQRHGRNVVSAGYFRVLGLPLLSGQGFSAAGAPKEAIINQTMARRYWPLENPVGKRFKEIFPGIEGAWMTVVGVVGDAVYNRDGEVYPVFYIQAGQSDLQISDLVMRTSGDPAALAPSARRVLQAIDPSLPIPESATVRNRLANLDRSRQFQTKLLAAFAFLAVLLSAIGLYGLMAYSISQRTREIGIRIALGATRPGIVKMILSQGFAWALAGVASGALGAIFFGKALSASLYGITATDPVTLGCMAIALFGIAVLASAIPAHRASKTDPAQALRGE